MMTGTLAMTAGSTIVESLTFVTTGTLAITAGSIVVVSLTFVTTGTLAIIAGSIIVSLTVVATGTLAITAGSIIIFSLAFVTIGTLAIIAGSIIYVINSHYLRLEFHWAFNNRRNDYWGCNIHRGQFCRCVNHWMCDYNWYRRDDGRVD